MPLTYTAYKGSSSGKISRHEITRADVAADEVLVRISHSGVCGTDEHLRHKDIVLGHEGVGVVEEVGDRVVQLVPSVYHTSHKRT